MPVPMPVQMPVIYNCPPDSDFAVGRRPQTSALGLVVDDDAGFYLTPIVGRGAKLL